MPPILRTVVIVMMMMMMMMMMMCWLEWGKSEPWCTAGGNVKWCSHC